MRFPARPPLVPTKVKYDVVISQNFGRQIDSWRARVMPNGGSEMHTVVVAEGLKRAGLSVAVLQPGPSFVRWGGVDYYSVQDVCNRGLWQLECDVLISQRFGELPPNVSFSRLVVEMHDLPDDRCQAIMPALAQVPGSKTVVHSQFNAALYPEWPGLTIIPAAFEDSLYEMASDKPHVLDRRDRTFVYGSAALKGLKETLQLWSELKRNHYSFKKAKLIVTSPGYDAPELDQLRDTPGVVYEQQKTQGDMMMRLANSDGIFMVNVLPETFGCVQTMCEIAGRPCWAMCINGPGALREVLANPWSIHTNINEFIEAIAKPTWPEMAPARDYRISTLLPQWLEVLGFGHFDGKVTEAGCNPVAIGQGGSSPSMPTNPKENAA